MSRTFSYSRVSTADQTTENQILEIATAGFDVAANRQHVESISGKTHAKSRPVFSELLGKLETGDTLVVTKLDRLGRDTIDILETVQSLGKSGIRVYCLALGGMDLNSPAGKMTMGVLATVAQFERELLIERTQAGLQRAKAEGKVLGRRISYTPEQAEAIKADLVAGLSVRKTGAKHGVSAGAIQRIKAM